MAQYVKTVWINKNDISFDPLTSPEVDADNLNKIEEGIYNSELNVYEILNNLSTAYAIIYNNELQDIDVVDSTMVWAIMKPSNDVNIITFDEIENTFTIKKPGTFNFSTQTRFNSTTGTPTLVTTNIVDSVLDTIWHTESNVVNVGIGEEIRINSNKQMKFVSGDLPKTFKIVNSADAAGIRIASLNYTLNTLAAGGDQSDHSGLTGTSDPNCHPISAITDLPQKLDGSAITGEAV